MLRIDRQKLVFTTLQLILKLATKSLVYGTLGNYLNFILNYLRKISNKKQASGSILAVAPARPISKNCYAILVVSIPLDALCTFQSSNNANNT